MENYILYQKIIESGQNFIIPEKILSQKIIIQKNYLHLILMKKNTANNIML